MKKIIAGIFFFCGFIIICFALYQIFSAEKQVKDTLEMAEQLVELGQEQNQNMQVEVSQSENAMKFHEDEIMGILRVPKINKNLPIIAGTDEDNLEKGVGHYTGTALPTEGEQIVLSGHRDTVFKEFEKLESGDTFVVELTYGKFTYEIRETEIVDADDVSVIRPRGEEVLTVTTCYPFHYVGNAPERFIFYAYPVDEKLLSL